MLPCLFFRAFLTSILSIVAATSAAAATAPLIWRGDLVTSRAFVNDIAKEYEKDKKGKITLQTFSTISGLDAVAAGTADIAGSARGKYDKRPEEQDITFIPVAFDAIVPITHPRNVANNLSLQQLRDIYLGKITNWQILGGSDNPINLYAVVAPLDGVEFSLRSLLFKNGDQRVAALRLYLNTAKLEEAIAIDPNGLGLSTLSGSASNKGVKMLGVENIPASSTNVSNGTYPLYNILYIAERPQATNKAAVDTFVQYLTTPTAQQVMRRHWLVPYADAEIVISQENDRIAYIDAHLADSPNKETPISAPNATLAAKVRIAPASPSTLEAKQRATDASIHKAAKPSS